MTIQISENYVWLSFSSSASADFIQKFWPKDWREGNFLKESQLKLLIDGDFIMASPLSVNVHDHMYDVRIAFYFEMHSPVRNLVEVRNGQSFFLT